MKTGIKLIKKERKRQISREGWTPEHDDNHGKGELAHAASCYARRGVKASSRTPKNWPWEDEWWKPSDDPVRNFTKAGALFLAEQDRLERRGRVDAADCRALNVNECAAEIDRLIQENSN